MLELDIYTVIAALSGLVIVSYIFTLISGKTRIPTVLLLLLLGVSIREGLTLFGVYVDIPLEFIQFFGVLGLILILLEAGLGLNISKEKLPLVRRATASSIFVLALSMVGIAAVVHYILGQNWQISFVYAVPLSVISSTVVASSINYLSESKREFLTYESSLSDIIGILVFNFLIAGNMFSLGLITLDIINVVIAIVASVAVSLLLLFLLVRTNVDVKAFLIFAVLLLIYALGHKWQMPTLLAVLIFGLIVNNWHTAPFRALHKLLRPTEVKQATSTIKSVTAESAFLIRTFFFTMFGYMIDVRVLGNIKVILVGTMIVLIIFLARYLYLRIFVRDHILPELFFAPRGLVTIVLFYSIPASMTFESFDEGVLFYVIMLTTVVMMLGSLWFTPKDATREAEEAPRGWRRLLKRDDSS